MPKETIHPHLPQLRDEKYNVVDVCWGRETDVQLGVRPAGEEKPGVLGLYADLSREEINHLIRSLRKARDQAYGPDE